MRITFIISISLLGSFVVFVNGAEQLLHDLFDRSILNLRTGCGCVAAATQRLQNHLHIGITNGAGGNQHLIILRVQHKGCGNAGNVQQIIRSSRLYRQEIAIAALNTPTTRVLAAQAADELLNISGISASFVLYPDGDTVFVSARSIGTANVQMILEPLGGGGNTATAGAQLQDTTVKDALDRLVASIDKFYEE